jgi:hypothetical protein
VVADAAARTRATVLLCVSPDVAGVGSGSDREMSGLSASAGLGIAKKAAPSSRALSAALGKVPRAVLSAVVRRLNQSGAVRAPELIFPSTLSPL